jgi:hypothetical protein
MPRRRIRPFFWWQLAGLVAVLLFFAALNHAISPAREMKPTDDQLRQLPAMGRPIMTEQERLEREIRLIELRNEHEERIHQLMLKKPDLTGPITTPGAGRSMGPPPIDQPRP